MRNQNETELAPDGFWVEPLEFPKKKDGKFHPKWIQEHAWDAWKNSTHGGKDWERPEFPVGIGNGSQPSLPASASGIPRNFGIVSLKTTTEKEKKIRTTKQTQPTLPKEKKKFPKKFRFGVSGNVGKAQNSRGEKEPGRFVSLGNCRVWKTSNGSEVRSTQNPRKMGSGNLPQQSPLPSRSLREKPNHAILNIGNLHFSFAGGGFSSRNRRNFGSIGMCRLLSRLEEEQGKGAATKSAHWTQDGAGIPLSTPQNSGIPERSRQKRSAKAERSR